MKKLLVSKYGYVEGMKLYKEYDLFERKLESLEYDYQYNYTAIIENVCRKIEIVDLVKCKLDILRFQLQHQLSTNETEVESEIKMLEEYLLKNSNN